MATRLKQIMVEPPADKMTGGLGKSDITVLQKSFPGSPVYRSADRLTDQVATEQYMNIVTNATVNDGGHTFGTVDLNYTGAPNLADVVVGGGGLPGSAYAPNIASPAEGQNPADIPESGVEATARVQGSGAPFSGDGLANPRDTSRVISGQTIGGLRLGKSSSTPA
jgi:hypothetical protein